jgi:CRISPR-associated protein Cmx8
VEYAVSEESTTADGAHQTKAPRLRQKRKPGAVDDTTVVKVRWTLHELPSSQHKAGLAGLAICVGFLKRKPDRTGVCEIESIDEHGMTLAVDRIGMRSLFDDVYDASIEETLSKSKWPNTEAKRVVDIEVKDPKTGKTKQEKRFVYDRVVPTGALISDWDSAAGGTPQLWLKLWRDLVWGTLRGVPATREPFNARADRRECADWAEAWEALAHSPEKTVDLPSTYAIGAQAKSAEDVPFKDVDRFRFLLHFWPFVVSVYVPAILKRDGTRDFNGFALAMPDVGILDAFVDAWPNVARGRRGEASGYRPRDAVVDVAGEAGLDVFRRSLEVIATKQGSTQAREWLTAVDVFHVEREGNNVRLRDVARVDPERKMVDEYSRIRGPYWSPVFRRQRVSNLLNGEPWWRGFARLCSVTPESMTFGHDYFQHDCKAAATEVEMKQDVPESEQTLEHLIYRRVQSYVLGKTDRKYDLSWSKVQGNASQEKEYREKKEKVGREAFLAVRSRTGADFVAFFTSTICSIPHHVSEDKYLEVARALMDPREVERVRSLTLLALSAIA